MLLLNTVKYGRETIKTVVLKTPFNFKTKKNTLKVSGSIKKYLKVLISNILPVLVFH